MFISYRSFWIFYELINTILSFFYELLKFLLSNFLFISEDFFLFEKWQKTICNVFLFDRDAVENDFVRVASSTTTECLTEKNFHNFPFWTEKIVYTQQDLFSFFATLNFVASFVAMREIEREKLDFHVLWVNSQHAQTTNKFEIYLIFILFRISFMPFKISFLVFWIIIFWILKETFCKLMTMLSLDNCLKFKNKAPEESWVTIKQSIWIK